MDLPNEMKGRAKGTANPQRPYAGSSLKAWSHTAEFSAPKAIIPVFPARINGKIQRLVCVALAV